MSAEFMTNEIVETYTPVKMARANECNSMDSARLTEKVVGPMYWKPLTPKSAEDAYFKGTKSKKCHVKKKKMPMDVVAPPQTDSVQGMWDYNRVHQIMPIKPPTHDEIIEQFTEEIQYLSLQDYQVHKKRFPKKVEPADEIWSEGDFPGIGRRQLQSIDSHDNSMIGKAVNYDRGSFNSTASLQDGPCRRVKVHESLSECMEIISVLSKYFVNCMVFSYQGVEHDGFYRTNPIPIKPADQISLSQRDKERIKCIVYSEVRHFISFNSGIPYKKRLERFKNSFKVLVEEFPTLGDVPSFAGLVKEEDLWSHK